MTHEERRAIEQDCARLVIAFHVFVDDFDHDRIVDLFAHDAVFHHGVLGPLRGKEMIKTYFDNKDVQSVQHHVTTNILVDVIDADHARGSAYWTATIAPLQSLPARYEGAISLGRYDDEFIRTPLGWRFAARRQTPRFEVPGLLGAKLLKEGADASLLFGGAVSR